ncbi:hypothetical protein AVEN_59424-1 [Araneus ventricosus]|uniref:Uncharacterized protein n=1 Tax=Araneus ventricosus TaxID=182803 RepID=A0A4Y2UT52_ARAVE|nr:hypothetical protein AVEN_59424-1 [Araneus ventricosus]
MESYNPRLYAYSRRLSDKAGRTHLGSCIRLRNAEFFQGGENNHAMHISRIDSIRCPEGPDFLFPYDICQDSLVAPPLQVKTGMAVTGSGDFQPRRLHSSAGQNLYAQDAPGTVTTLNQAQVDPFSSPLSRPAMRLGYQPIDTPRTKCTRLMGRHAH